MTDGINLTGVLDALDEKAEGERITIGAMVDAIGERGFGPLILAAALVELMPTGGIPGIPTAVALTVIAFAVQLLAGRKQPWFPEILRRRGLSRKKFYKGRDALKVVTKRVDRLFKHRLHIFVGAVGARMVGLVCILLAMTMPPMEIIPWLSYIPAAAIALLAAGLSTRDGLVVLLGLIFASVGVTAIALWLL